MRTLYFEYDYTVEFDQDVYDHQFQLRCIPRDGTHQKVLEIHYNISPEAKVSVTKDGFGNPTYVGGCLENHRYFTFSVKGKMICSNEPLIPPGRCFPIYKYETALTKADEAIQSFARRHQLNDQEETCWELMHAVYDRMRYVPGSTSNYTTASQAFAQSKGVCQDYAHILIASLRSLNIPARYVAGMMIGEGATHAWVDAYVGDHFIYLDPTNNCEADDRYIKLSHGRDFQDCVIDRGIFNCRTVCNQKMSVYVKVKEIKTSSRENNALENCWCFKNSEVNR